MVRTQGDPFTDLLSYLDFLTSRDYVIELLHPILALNLVKRTLTNLYNARPAWLDHAHRQLDEVVCAAYGWDASLGDDAILERLLALNLERSGAALSIA